MNFTDAIKSGFQNYANFSGRDQRSAFWYWVLFSVIVGTVLTLVDQQLSDEGTPILSGLFSLATLIPNLAIAARRLHDTDRSGWWQLLVFIPLIGIIVLIVWYASRGTSGPNRFGPNPLGE
jgi:uncharacterized membrane protein YhaH (DUF805 family)